MGDALVDEVWSERNTTPAKIEAALRRIVAKHYHSADPSRAAARVLKWWRSLTASSARS